MEIADLPGGDSPLLPGGGSLASNSDASNSPPRGSPQGSSPMAISPAIDLTRSPGSCPPAPPQTGAAGAAERRRDSLDTLPAGLRGALPPQRPAGPPAPSLPPQHAAPHTSERALELHKALECGLSLEGERGRAVVLLSCSAVLCVMLSLLLLLLLLLRRPGVLLSALVCHAARPPTLPPTSSPCTHLNSLRDHQQPVWHPGHAASSRQLVGRRWRLQQKRGCLSALRRRRSRRCHQRDSRIRPEALPLVAAVPPLRVLRAAQALRHAVRPSAAHLQLTEAHAAGPPALYTSITQ